MIQIAKMLEHCRVVTRIFGFLGRNTLEILCIHCLDSIFFHWEPDDVMIRVMLDLSVFVIYLAAKSGICWGCLKIGCRK